MAAIFTSIGRAFVSNSYAVLVLGTRYEWHQARRACAVEGERC
jgi:hypothetical protein